MVMRALVMVRPYTLDPDGVIVPTLWAAATLQLDTDRCLVIWPRGREEHPEEYVTGRIVARHVASMRCAMVIHGPADLLRAIKARFEAVWTIAELRTDASTIGQRIRSNWIDDRTERGDTGPLVALRGGYSRVPMAADLEATAPGDVA